jgi:hypothetical protein
MSINSKIEKFLYKYIAKYSICLVKEYKQISINISQKIFYNDSYRLNVHTMYFYTYFCINNAIIHRIACMLNNGDDYIDEFSANMFKYINNQRKVRDDMYLIECVNCNSDKIDKMYHSKDDIFYYKHINLYNSLFL